MSVHHSSRVMKNAEDFSMRICGCGVVHLNFGATSVTATPEAVIGMAETLKEVAHTLKGSLRNHDPVNADPATIDPAGNIVAGRFPPLTDTFGSR